MLSLSAPPQEGAFALDVPFSWTFLFSPPTQTSAQTPLPHGNFLSI